MALRSHTTFRAAQPMCPASPRSRMPACGQVSPRASRTSTVAVQATASPQSRQASPKKPRSITTNALVIAPMMDSVVMPSRHMVRTSQPSSPTPLASTVPPTTNDSATAPSLEPAHVQSVSTSQNHTHALERPTVRAAGEVRACAAGAAVCCGMSFAQTVNYLAATKTAPGVIRLKSLMEFNLLRTVASGLGLAVVATFHCGSDSECPSDKPLVGEYHKQLNDFFHTQLKASPAIFIKCQLDAEEGCTPGKVSGAWKNFRLANGEKVMPCMVTQVESMNTGVAVVADRPCLTSVQQAVADVLFRASARIAHGVQRRCFD